MRDVETIVVGGGPAGSALAAQLTRAGRECLVLERKPMPRVKLCAGWLRPKVLADLGIQAGDYPHGIRRLRQVKVIFGRRHRWSAVLSTEQYSIRRIEFDDWLLRRAGAEVVQHTARRIERQDGRYVIDGQYRSRYLVGAGGTACPVRHALFDRPQGRLVLTREVEYACAPPRAMCTLWFPFACPSGYAWYVPKADAVNIGFGGYQAELANWNPRGLWLEFLALLRAEGCLTPQVPDPQGHPYYLGDRRKTVKKDRAYLLGDAAGLATVDLAEGIGPAIESGVLAAKDILGEDVYSADKITKYSLGPVTRLLRRLARIVP